MEVQGEDVEGWIVDIHTHILPPRLALKIRQFFESQISQSIEGETSSTLSTSCCGGGGGGDDSIFRDQEEWKEEDFDSHGPFKLEYHPFDPQRLTEEQRANGVGSIWILPYAHKGSIAEKLNSSIVEICSTLENSTLRNKKGEMKQAIAAFTVHPQDGLEGVKEATLKALVQGGARAAKLHCSVGRYSVLDDTLTPFWQLAEVVKFPVIVHAGSHASGNTASDELNNVEQLLSKYHNIQLIIAHSGHPAILKSIKLALKYDNVYLDTTPVVTRTPQYPPRSHPLYTDLINLAKQGRILFGTDMPNVAVPLAKQIQIVFQTFANKDWIRPTSNKWWTKRQEAQRAGSAVEEVLFGAARKLLSQVDISKAKQQVVKGNSGSSKI